MSEIISNENKLSMLINDTMEAMAEVSSCKSKASCISLDAGPLQRVSGDAVTRCETEGCQ